MRSKISPNVQGEPSFIEAARRAQIIKCAIDTIAQLGYERASLAEIAQRAKVSKSVISYYFASKDELIVQVVHDVYETGAEFMKPRFEHPTTATAALRIYIESNIEFMETHRNHVQALVEIATSFRASDGKLRFDPKTQESVIEDVEGILKWGQQTKEFGAFSTVEMAFAIRAVIDSLPPRAAYYPDLDLKTYGRELADLFERAALRQDTNTGTRKAGKQ